MKYFAQASMSSPVSHKTNINEQLKYVFGCVQETSSNFTLVVSQEYYEISVRYGINNLVHE